MTAGPGPATGRSRARGLLLPIAVTVVLTGVIAATYGFGFYLFALVVPEMRADLGFGYAAAGTVAGGTQIGFVAFALTGGMLSRRLGAARVILGSVLLCGACLAALSAASSLPAIGALLAVLGGCAASAYVPMVELVSRTVRFEHRGKALGLISSGTSYGVFANGLIVPGLALDGNWRGAWLAAGAATLALAAAVHAAFARAGLLGRATAPAQARQAALAPARPSRTTVLLWAIAFLNGFSLLPFQTYLAPHLREDLGFGAEVAGRVWAAIGLVGMGAGVAVGALADRIGIRAALMLAYGCVTGSAALILTASGPAALMLAGIAFALAFYPIFGLIPAYIGKTAAPGASTAAFAAANAALGLGAMAGNLLGGWSGEHLGTFSWVYVAAGTLAAMLAVMAAALPCERGAGRRD